MMSVTTDSQQPLNRRLFVCTEYMMCVPVSLDTAGRPPSSCPSHCPRLQRAAPRPCRKRQHLNSALNFLNRARLPASLTASKLYLTYAESLAAVSTEIQISILRFCSFEEKHQIVMGIDIQPYSEVKCTCAPRFEPCPSRLASAQAPSGRDWSAAEGSLMGQWFYPYLILIHFNISKNFKKYAGSCLPCHAQTCAFSCLSQCSTIT